MLFDKENQLSVNQAFTATAVTEHSYQKQSAAQDISIGRMMAIVFIVKVAAGAGSTWSFAAVQADVSALTTNLEVLAVSHDYLAAALTVGTVIVVPFPQGSMSRLHIGGKAFGATGTVTLTADCYLMPLDEVPVFKSFPKVVDAAV